MMLRLRRLPHTLCVSRSLGFILLSSLFMVNCSQKIVVKDPDSIILNNHGNRTITKLVIKPCDKPAEEFKEMAQGIKPGATRFILLYPGCFDADALDENGEIMATQYRVRIPPQLHWHIY